MRHSRSLRRFCLAGAALLAQPAWVAAQILPQDTTPGVIPVYGMGRPEYDPPGVSLGSFNLSPSLSETLNFDDNIFASDLHKVSDLINTTGESLSFASQWSRHYLGGRIYSSQQIYKDHDVENANVYGVGINGRLDVSREAFFDLEAGFVQQPQLRNSPEADINALERPLYNTATVTIGYTQGLGRLTNRADVTYIKNAYIQSAEDDRSDNNLRYHDRLSLDASRFVSIFVDGSYAVQDWLLKSDLRNFNTTTGTLGASIKITDEVEGEIAVGVARQTYSNPSFSTLVTPTIKGELRWSILPLTSLSAMVDRTITGTESFCDTSQTVAGCQALLGLPLTSPARDQRSVVESDLAEIGIQHEFWHDLLGEARFRYGHDKFQLRDLVDDNYVVNLNGRYLINRHFELDLGYVHNIRQANKNILFFNSGAFTENLVTLSLKAAY